VSLIGNTELFGIRFGISELPLFDRLSVECDCIAGYLAPCFPFSQPHQRRIDSDFHHPGGKLALPPEAMQVLIRPQVGFLKKILCIFSMLHDAEYSSLNHCAISLAEFGERTQVSGLRIGKQLII